MNKERLTAQVALHEGCRLKPYSCSQGKLTIGYGRNLQDVGITIEEAQLMLARDLDRAIAGARALANSHWDRLTARRQEVLVEMVFQMGARRVGQFRNMWNAIQNRKWSVAADEMLDSLWAKQTPTRAEKLSDQFRSG